MLQSVKEVFFGGAAGGGKSDWLLMEALLYVEQPNYNAILFRQTLADLKLPGALIDRANQWLRGTDARYNGSDYKWTFPSGATLTFGYLRNDQDALRYKSAEFQFVGFDELTKFEQNPYTYMFSRARRNVDSNIPIRIRGASNPGDRGHVWVKERFVEKGNSRDRVFIPATIHDNPHLDVPEYITNLSYLPEIELKRLLDGDWDATLGGGLFKGYWMKVMPPAMRLPSPLRLVRSWDLAGTDPSPDNPNPDWTAGVLQGHYDVEGELLPLVFILHVDRFRCNPAEVEKRIQERTMADWNEWGFKIDVGLEVEPGQSGKAQLLHYKRTVLKDFKVIPFYPRVSKKIRAQPLIAVAGRGRFFLMPGAWNATFRSEFDAWQGNDRLKDDQIDGTSSGYDLLRKKTIKPLPILIGETPADPLEFIKEYAYSVSQPGPDGEVVDIEPDSGQSDDDDKARHRPKRRRGIVIM